MKGTEKMKRKWIALALVLTFACMLTSCGLTVPRPEVKEGQFHFSITYELNGEEKTFLGVYVCEFDGTSWSLDGGSGRDWKAHTEGEYEGDDYSAVVGKTEDGGDVILFFGIYPEYFMGDSMGDRGEPEPSIYIAYPEDENGSSGLVNDPEEVAKTYGARIISYEYDEPVQNSFALFHF